MNVVAHIIKKVMNSLKTNSTGKDINWINALRALCILLVFLRHSENYYGQDLGWFDSLFLPFYVNAFFFMSGYLLFRKQLSLPRIAETRREYLCGGGQILALNILFRIVIPSIIFATIEFFPKKVIKGEEISVPDLLVETVGGCTYWFTSALMVAELLFLVLLLTRKRNIWFYAVFGFVFSAFGRYLSSIDFSFVNGYGSLPWLYKHGLMCMCYIALGGLYWKYEAMIHKLMKPWLAVVLTVLYISGSIVFRSYLSVGYMTSMEQIHITGVLWSLLASILLVEGCMKLPRIELLTFIGQNSIGFYFMAGALPVTFSILAHKYILSTHVWMVLIIYISCILVAYPLMKIMTIWMPWLFDLRLMRNKN